MEEQVTKTITAFDSLFTNNKIQMLKILLPRLIPEQQGGFAVYIKLLELQKTILTPWNFWMNCCLSADQKNAAKYKI